MKRANTCLATNAVLACCVWHASFCAPCLGQDIDPELVRGEDVQALWDQGIYPLLEEILPSPGRTASHLMEECDLIADGEFFAFPYSSPEALRTLRPEDVRIDFRIHRLYKGEASKSIEVRLISDMLAYPGEALSRYAKREIIHERRREDLRPVYRQIRKLERAYKDGEITRQDFEKEDNRLTAIVLDRIDQDSLYSGSRSVGAIHGETFYDRGGAISPETSYLICVAKLTEGAGGYFLEEDPWDGAANIYWGEMRDYVLPGFDEPALDQASQDE